VISHNRIHDCGELPATNHDHGVYVEAADHTRITDNFIYDNADRGIQLYPDAQHTYVARNVIDGNGQGVIFGGGSEGGGYRASGHNLVEHNVISNSRVRWNVESSWPGRAGRGNMVRRNCVFATNGDRRFRPRGGIGRPDGFRSRRNLVASPRFVDRGAGDLRLRRGSRCLRVRGLRRLAAGR
jgi:nitrous oxidase accessory protein NosD